MTYRTHISREQEDNELALDALEAPPDPQHVVSGGEHCPKCGQRVPYLETATMCSFCVSWADQQDRGAPCPA